MFRISKLLLSTKTNLELFRTVQNYNDHFIKFVDIIELSIIGYQISNIMGKQSRKEIVYEEPPKKRGRQAGAKTYNKQTVFKLISQLKPTNMVLWGTDAVIIDQHGNRGCHKQLSHITIVYEWIHDEKR